MQISSIELPDDETLSNTDRQRIPRIKKKDTEAYQQTINEFFQQSNGGRAQRLPSNIHSGSARQRNFGSAS
jgi:hypothetical protein